MSEKNFTTTNPFDGSILQTRRHLRLPELQGKLSNSQRGYETWSKKSLEERREALEALKKNLLKRREILAETITLEMGKPITESLAEVDKCVKLIDYCVAEAPRALAVENRAGYVKILQPQGVIYGIMPWNFPIWQTLRFCIPTILAGNTVLVKPADNVAATGEKLGEVFAETGALENVYHNISIDHEMSDELIADPRVRGVSFTGSSRAGRHIAATAGKFLKKCVLELGGNDAYIVFADSDVKMAAKKSFDARILNAGQSCISAKRFLVEESVENEFLSELRFHLEEAVMGNPLSEDTRIGPVARADQKKKLEEQLAVCEKEGAKIFHQKKVPPPLPKSGSFFSPTILRNVDPKGTAFQDEIFGPVFLVTTFKTEDEAIRLANQSPYGLGGAVFSKDATKTRRVAEALDTGSVALNDFFRSSPERPFGGVKDSGFGRELGPEGFWEFLNLKILVQAASAQPAAE
jgi:succinate-semialdehyde dehydrogenase/glutarate-semialdehyde dehydrogenase